MPEMISKSIIKRGLEKELHEACESIRGQMYRIGQAAHDSRNARGINGDIELRNQVGTLIQHLQKAIDYHDQVQKEIRNLMQSPQDPLGG